MGNQQNKLMDHVIIQQRKQQKEAKIREEEKSRIVKSGNDINSGKAIINDDMVLFHRMLMIESNISMVVPIEFNEMSEELIKKLYDDSYQPQHAYMNPDGTITVLFDVLFSDTDEESFTLVRNEMLRNFRKEYNDFAISYKLYKTEQQNDVYYFIKKQQIKEGVIYTIVFLMIIKGFIVMGNIGCVGHRIKDWKDIMYQMMTTIMIEEIEDATV